MVTKHAPQVDGRMDGQTDATQTILLAQLSAELKIKESLSKVVICWQISAYCTDAYFDGNGMRDSQNTFWRHGHCLLSAVMLIY
jgi:hypothetical protein